jgi:hypothetical protein
MANKLISQLGVRANVLVTDLVEFEPAAGAPSQKGTVTKIFTDATGSLAIDRDNRQLKVSGNVSVDWSARQLSVAGAGSVSLDWANYIAYASDNSPSVRWNSFTLGNSNTPVVLDWTLLQLFDTASAKALDWDNRLLKAANGTTTVLDWSTQQPSSGAQTAGAIYTAVEKVMLQEAYDALLAYGLLAP